MAGLLSPALGKLSWNGRALDEDFLAKNILWMGQETPLSAESCGSDGTPFRRMLRWRPSTPPTYARWSSGR
jgi:hypothetical protein